MRSEIPASLPSYLKEAAFQYRLTKARTNKSVNPDPVDWIQQHFYIPETNAPIQLIPYQRAVIREALRQDENGLFVYSFILWSDLKKSAKSTIAGAMSLYLAWHHPFETVRVVANDLKQADSRTFYYIERAIKLNPVLAQQCRMKTYHIDLPNESTIDAIPVDPKGEAGGGDLVTTFTEMWAMKNKASQALWTETTLSPLKYGKSIRIGESYAGFKGESPILEPLYDVGVTNGQQIDLSFEDKDGYHDLNDLEVYRNKRTLTLWNTTPRCPWQTPEYYAQEAGVLTQSEMDRIHGNKWADSVGAFVPLEWWKQCKSDYELKSGEGVIMGIDAAATSDCFAVVLVSRHEYDVYVHYARKWSPPKGGAIQFSEPEAEIRRLIKEYNVLELAYDKHQLVDMMQRLRNDVYAPTRDFSQMGDRLIADKRLYDLIRDKRIHHHGEADLEEHISNSAAEINKAENSLRIVKREMDKKIDLAVALSMAAARSFSYAVD